jgi:adenylate cyclase class 2
MVLITKNIKTIQRRDNIMGKVEKEVKVLDVNVEEISKKLKNIGADYLRTIKQQIYTYDIPTIYHRFIEAKEMLKSDNDLLIKTTLEKLDIIFTEFSDLVGDNILSNIFKSLNVTDFKELLSQSNKEILFKITNSDILNETIKSKLINPNKWIRLRKSNEKVELTTKHVFQKNNLSVQKVLECEIGVSSFEETNNLLESIGIVRRNYQEKIRHSFKYKSAEIEIDEWPMLKPYMEIECDDEAVITEIIEKLNVGNKEIVSLNTEQLYKKINIDVLKISDLKFDSK